MVVYIILAFFINFFLLQIGAVFYFQGEKTLAHRFLMKSYLVLFVLSIIYIALSSSGPFNLLFYDSSPAPLEGYLFFVNTFLACIFLEAYYPKDDDNGDDGGGGDDDGGGGDPPWWDDFEKDFQSWHKEQKPLVFH